jgi:hypothetical protein
MSFIVLASGLAAVGARRNRKGLRSGQRTIRPLSYKQRMPLIGAGFLVAASLNAATPDSSNGDGWQYAATIYLWGSGIDAKTARGEDVSINFNTLIDNLNMTFMGALEARKAKWSMLADVIYLNVGASQSGKVPVPVGPASNVLVKVNADVKTRGWVLDFVGAYNLWQTPEASVDVLAGARYLELKLDSGLSLSAGPFARALSFSDSDSVWDGVVGVRGHLDLNPKMYVPYYLDVGTGQSELTWQASAGFAYRFNWGDVSLLYRYMKWDYDSSSQLDNISFSGPLLAAKFVF